MKKVALVLYARFPSEMAYGNHIIQIANGFINNGYEVDIYYPFTDNKKTINELPTTYYNTGENIDFFQISNFDITKLKVYEILPSIIKQLLYSLNTFIWSRKVKEKLLDYDFIWSTNPNILSSFLDRDIKLIYEKHGAARFIQKNSIKKLQTSANTTLVGVTKTSYKELSNGGVKALYIPNGVDTTLFKYNKKTSGDLNVGFIGHLETYGVDKGVVNSTQKMLDLMDEIDFRATIIGGPKKKLEDIKKLAESANKVHNLTISDYVPQIKVPEILSTLDIGIVPYPNEEHMSKYASPLKIFELAACGVPILASDIQTHKELEEFNLGIVYFQHGNFEDFSEQLKSLLQDKEKRESLRNLSIENIKNFSWESRIKKII